MSKKVKIFIVTTKKVEYQDYEITASDEQEAIEMVANGLGNPIDNQENYTTVEDDISSWSVRQK
jgi:hypothetical protein